MKKITIEDGGAVAVISTNCASVHQFGFDGVSVIYPKTIIRERHRGGIPVIFPFFGEPETCFIVHEATKKHVMLIGQNNPTKIFPWKLEYELTVSVNSSGWLMLKFITKRLEDGLKLPVPVNPGFCPYFCSNKFFNAAKNEVTIGPRKITDFQKKSVSLSFNESIIINSGGRSLKMVLSGDFNLESKLKLWSDNPQEYFCVEPTLTDPSAIARLDYGGKFLYEGEQSKITAYFSVI